MLSNKGGNSQTVKQRLSDLGMDDKMHRLIESGKRQGAFRRGKHMSIPIEEILVKDSTYSRSRLKQRLIEANLLPQRCAICNSPPEWRSHPMVLVLDHVNGDPKDNRLFNLRLLCPNCNSQTRTFCGKNKKRAVLCICCKAEISRRSTWCRSCAGKKAKTRIIWPNNEELVQMVKNTSFSAVGRQLGVSDNAVRKRLKRRGLLCAGSPV